MIFLNSWSGFRALLLTVPFAILLSAGAAAAGEDLTVGRMFVAIRPEYDDPGLLAVYDGRFTSSGTFPTETSFFLPKGAVISDACSLSPKGQHFCQLYKVVEREDADEVILKLPYSNFYLSFHLPLPEAVGEQRTFDYTVKTSHPVQKLEVSIQQPLRSSDFSVLPPGGKLGENNGFKLTGYVYENVAQGEKRSFRISYKKKDRKPSMEIKYQNEGMDGTQILAPSSSPYETQRKIKWFVYAMFGAALAAAGATGWFVIRRRS